MLITPAQIRAARALLRMDQDELARRANVSVVTVRRLEAPDGLSKVGLVLLRHSFCTTAFLRICPQQGHRGSACAKVRARRIRKVAIEFGMWRCERSGRSSGSMTDGKGRLRASPGAGMS